MSHTRPVHLCQSHVVTYQHLLEVAGGEAAPTILGKGTSCCNEAANQRPAFVKHSSHFSYTLFLRGGFVIDLFDPFSLHPWYLFHSSSLFSRFPSSSLGSFHIYRFFRLFVHICAFHSFLCPWVSLLGALVLFLFLLPFRSSCSLLERGGVAQTWFEYPKEGTTSRNNDQTISNSPWWFNSFLFSDFLFIASIASIASMFPSSLLLFLFMFSSVPSLFIISETAALARKVHGGPHEKYPKNQYFQRIWHVFWIGSVFSFNICFTGRMKKDCTFLTCKWS